MKRILSVAYFVVLLLTILSGHSAASDVVISGSSQFDCSLSVKYMEKHGYQFIEESYYENYLSTNMYGARGAEVIVENEHGVVLGSGKADEKGRFSIAVPRDELYRVVVRFHGQEGTKQVQLPKVENIIVYVGYFKSDMVDSWLRSSARRDCESC